MPPARRRRAAVADGKFLIRAGNDSLSGGGKRWKFGRGHGAGERTDETGADGSKKIGFEFTHRQKVYFTETLRQTCTPEVSVR